VRHWNWLAAEATPPVFCVIRRELFRLVTCINIYARADYHHSFRTSEMMICNRQHYKTIHFETLGNHFNQQLQCISNLPDTTSMAH
jgi:hypothetical protein